RLKKLDQNFYFWLSNSRYQTKSESKSLCERSSQNSNNQISIKLQGATIGRPCKINLSNQHKKSLLLKEQGFKITY
ncbi:MAG: hypothetical protein ACI4JM_05160, partial [Oscillospiraceae bacterium]